MKNRAIPIFHHDRQILQHRRIGQIQTPTRPLHRIKAPKRPRHIRRTIQRKPRNIDRPLHRPDRRHQIRTNIGRHRLSHTLQLQRTTDRTLQPSGALKLRVNVPIWEILGKITEPLIPRLP